MIHHGGYFAAAGIGVQSFRTGRTPDVARALRAFCHECRLCRSHYAAFVTALCRQVQFRLTVNRHHR